MHPNKLRLLFEIEIETRFRSRYNFILVTQLPKNGARYYQGSISNRFRKKSYPIKNWSCRDVNPRFAIYSLITYATLTFTCFLVGSKKMMLTALGIRLTLCTSVACRYINGDELVVPSWVVGPVKKFREPHRKGGSLSHMNQWFLLVNPSMGS